MKKITCILISSIIWSASFSQRPDQGQLYAGSSDKLIDFSLNSTSKYSFNNIDDFIFNSQPDQFASFENLANYLTQQFDDKRSQVRSIYTWIALNISYDQKSTFPPHQNKQQANDVWKNRVAVCEGYANLFQDMCEIAGIESRVIKGYVRDIDGNEMRFPNHAWNSVKIDGKWQLLDVSWASANHEEGAIKSATIQEDFTRKKLDYFFFVNPKKMILTHLPEDPYWQLQNNFVNMDVFQYGEEYIQAVVQNQNVKENDFEDLIECYESLDSLDRSISFLERMEDNKWNKVKEYGLGIAYYYKAQDILRETKNISTTEARQDKKLARMYYKKSLDQLSSLNENDFGYEFSIDLANNVEFKIEALQ